MADPINVGAEMFQAGRADVRHIDPEKSKLSYNADFSGTADITFDFNAARSNMTFTVPRFMFMDNGANPSEVEVSVSQTDQFFTIPPNAQGYFPIDAMLGSTIKIVTAGGSADKATITFYNYEMAGLIWYKFGTFNNNKPILVEGAMNEGDTVAAQTANNPVYIGGKDYTTGLFRALSVDANGMISINNAASVLGSVNLKTPAALDWVYATTNNDTIGAVATNACAIVNTVGRMWNPATSQFDRIRSASPTLNSNGVGVQNVAISAQRDDTSPTAITEDNFGNLRLSADRSLLTSQRSTTGANSSLAATVTASTTLMAANTSRKGGTIFNDNTFASAVEMFVSLGATCTTSSFSYCVQPRGTVEIPFGYVGIITCVFSAATGNARTTELV